MTYKKGEKKEVKEHCLSPAHARSKRILPDIIVREGLLRKTGPGIVRDRHVLDKVRPPLVRVAEVLRHEPFVWLYRLEAVAHVATSSDDQLREVATVGHNEHVRL